MKKTIEHRAHGGGRRARHAIHISPMPSVTYAAPPLVVNAVPVPVVEYISPAPAVSHGVISPAPAVYAAPATDLMYMLHVDTFHQKQVCRWTYFCFTGVFSQKTFHLVAFS